MWSQIRIDCHGNNLELERSIMNKELEERSKCRDETEINAKQRQISSKRSF